MYLKKQTLKKMDVVICMSLKDCWFFRKNLYFIKKNINPNHIYVLTDKRNFNYIPNVGSLITCVDENEVVDHLTFSVCKSIVENYLTTQAFGWYYQQLLKLGFALSRYAKDEYLVWDSDTVPLSELNFKDEEGHDLVLVKKERHVPYFNTIDGLFHAPKKAPYSFISEHMLFNVSIVKEMLSLIEEKSQFKLPWFEQCIAARKEDVVQVFSEFETYGTFCYNYHPGKLKVRPLNTFRLGSKIFGVMASRKEIQSLSFDLDTVSFEMRDYPVSWHRRFVQCCIYWTIRTVIKCRVKFGKFPL